MSQYKVPTITGLLIFYSTCSDKPQNDNFADILARPYLVYCFFLYIILIIYSMI